jgi:heme exporter protein D
MTLQEFFHMGGYAAYVWSSVGLTLVVLIANALSARRAVNRELERLRRRFADSPNTGGSQ